MIFEFVFETSWPSDSMRSSLHPEHGVAPARSRQSAQELPKLAIKKFKHLNVSNGPAAGLRKSRNAISLA